MKLVQNPNFRSGLADEEMEKQRRDAKVAADTGEARVAAVLGGTKAFEVSKISAMPITTLVEDEFHLVVAAAVAGGVPGSHPE